MDSCFVIQPFDRQFDKLFEDTLVPAIKGADLQEYRVDRDPSSRVLIDSIENGIRDSAACIAEITTNNPNVWFELGFALAHGRPIVMICNTAQRTSEFPFDIRHRPIITYKPESPRDFSELQKKITERLKALVKDKAEIKLIASMESSVNLGGLLPHEMAALRIVMEYQLGKDDYVLVGRISDEMESVGLNRLATSLALRSLEKSKRLETFKVERGYEPDDWGCRVTELGIEWLLDHQDSFSLESNEKSKTKAAAATADVSLMEISDDDVPF